MLKLMTATFGNDPIPVMSATTTVSTTPQYNPTLRFLRLFLSIKDRGLMAQTIGKSGHPPPLGCFVVAHESTPEFVVLKRSLLMAVDTTQHSRLIARRHSPGDRITTTNTNDITH
jgi:hypothetical protein